MDDYDLYKLKKLIDEIKKYRGRHTVFISYYVPAGYNLSLVLNHLAQELHTAQNIKDRNTRKNVIAALETLINRLKLIKQTPPNGLVMFAGNVASAEGGYDMKVWLIEPPKPLGIRLYRCGQEFVTQPLEDLLKSKDKFGLLVLDNREATFGILEGHIIKEIKSLESLVPHETRKGGQSANRFKRVRQALRQDFYEKVAEEMKELFSDDSIKGILLGGPGPIKEIFIEYIPNEIKKKIIGIVPTSLTGYLGLRELVNRGLEYIENTKLAQEKIIIQEFMKHLAKDDGYAVYGYDDVKRALEMGSVDTLILYENLDEKIVDELVNLAKKFGSKVIFVSDKHDEGIMFKNFGGIGAILRFKV